LALSIEFPMPAWIFVRGIEDGLFEETVLHAVITPGEEKKAAISGQLPPRNRGDGGR
jgi:hypothetical protein